MTEQLKILCNELISLCQRNDLLSNTSVVDAIKEVYDELSELADGTLTAEEIEQELFY